MGCAIDHRAWLGCSALAALIAGATPTAAQDYGDLSGKTLIATADWRIAAADGERSWIDGGFGKTRFGPDQASASDRLIVNPRTVDANLVWSPQVNWALGAVIAATAQTGQEHLVDLSEAFLTWRRDPIGSVKLSARAGMFWPPVSLEHSGADWAVTNTITPSAISSWISEEVKVAAAEGSASVPLAGGRITGTAAIFGFNDTAGTLLAFRGWALHDEKATIFGRQPLPPLNAFMQNVQASSTRPVIELDNRPGYYLRLNWASGNAAKVHLFYYDNRGNPQAVTDQLQWGWRTRFTEIGGSIALDSATQLTAQAMAGRTQMGFAQAGLIWVDTRFKSVYALVTRRIGAGSVSGRLEAFGTRGLGSVLGADESEDGWAATLAARRSFGEHLSVLAEALRVDSNRESRLRVALMPKQAQTVLQLSLRLHN